MNVVMARACFVDEGRRIAEDCLFGQLFSAQLKVVHPRLGSEDVIKEMGTSWEGVKREA